MPKMRVRMFKFKKKWVPNHFNVNPLILFERNKVTEFTSMPAGSGTGAGHTAVQRSEDSEKPGVHKQ